MPEHREDIQFAISTSMQDGEELTLEALNGRLFEAFPSLQDDPRWIGVAVNDMLKTGSLLPVGWDGKGAFRADQVVKLGPS